MATETEFERRHSLRHGSWLVPDKDLVEEVLHGSKSMTVLLGEELESNLRFHKLKIIPSPQTNGRQTVTGREPYLVYVPRDDLLKTDNTLLSAAREAMTKLVDSLMAEKGSDSYRLADYMILGRAGFPDPAVFEVYLRMMTMDDLYAEQHANYVARLNSYEPECYGYADQKAV